jgi:hypothetical protein
MKRIVAVALLFAAGGLLLPGRARTAPKPAEVPTSWQLDIDYDPPKAILVSLPGKSKPQVFWYMRYTVTNNSNDEHVFVPNCVLYTNTGEIIPAGRNVPTTVFDAVKKLHNAPLLKDVTSITGSLLRGEDNAKDGVAIWPDFDPAAGEIDIFFGGLSGETAEVELPGGKTIEVTETDGFGNQRTVQKTKMLVSKTLHLHFAVPGEAASRLNTVAKLLDKEWVMR